MDSSKIKFHLDIYYHKNFKMKNLNK